MIWTAFSTNTHHSCWVSGLSFHDQQGPAADEDAWWYCLLSPEFVIRSSCEGFRNGLSRPLQLCDSKISHPSTIPPFVLPMKTTFRYPLQLSTSAPKETNEKESSRAFQSTIIVAYLRDIFSEIDRSIRWNAIKYKGERRHQSIFLILMG